MSTTSCDLTAHINRLQQVSIACGVGDDGTTYGSAQSAAAGANLEAMTPFEKSQYLLALKVRNLARMISELRQLEGLEKSSAAAGSGSTHDESRPLASLMGSSSSSSSPSPSLSNSQQAQKAKLAQSIRAEIKQCKNDLVAFRPIAKAAGVDKKERYDELKNAIEKTESLYKSRFRMAAVGEEGTDVDGVPFARSIPILPSPNLSDDSTTTTMGGAPLLSLREDQEFQPQFQAMASRDQQIDDLTDETIRAVGRLKVNAEEINSEVKSHIVILEQSEKKVDDVSTNLKGVNKKLKKTIQSVEKDRMCCYLLCFFLLLLVLGVLIYVVMNRDGSSGNNNSGNERSA